MSLAFFLGCRLPARLSLLRSNMSRGSIVGTRCCLTMAWDRISATMGTEGILLTYCFTNMTADDMSATMA
jgi:hypothetical protein